MNDTTEIKVAYLISQDERRYYATLNKGEGGNSVKYERFYGVSTSSLDNGAYDNRRYIDFYGSFTVEHIDLVIRVRFK